MRVTAVTALLWLVAVAVSVVQAQVQCTNLQDQGCFRDSADNRTFAFAGNMAQTSMTREACATLCYTFNFSLSAVEYGYQCFCGTQAEFHRAVSAPSSDCNEPCTGASTEMCGAANRMNIIRANCSGKPVPTGHACLSAATRELPFCNTSLSIGARLDDLIGRLSLQEKAGLIGPDPVTSPCAFLDYGVKRLDIPPYLHLVETNTAVASACISQDKCATTFIGPTGLGAAFNRSLWNLKGEVISTEMRAFNNLNWHRGGGVLQKIGLTGFGPNINIIRDPRFGRNSELPSEDPFLSGEYATAYVTGCQDGPDKKYKKMAAGLKHFDAYSVETNRMAFNGNISTFDLWDTYLPQYKRGFVDGGALAAMCSYASINGVPSCANNLLLNNIVRGQWKRDMVTIGTDCGAIANMVNANKYARDPVDAVAKTLNGGADMELGETYFTTNGYLEQAVQQNRTTINTVNNAVRRVLYIRFITGQFDPIDATPYTSIGLDGINSARHQQINFEAAIQGLVLLKNDDRALPLSTATKVAVVGPHSITRGSLLSDYAGDQQCFSGSDDCIPTIGEWITKVNTNGHTRVQQGVDINSQNTSGIQAALDAVSTSDVVVLCLGIDRSVEHEGIDRTSTDLPGLQTSFAQQVLKTAGNKRVILVLINGGALSIDGLTKGPAAIVEAFYPALRGAEALARTLFGEHNRFGKLPYTIYSSSFQQECELTDMQMSPHANCKGRTYRYYMGQPLYPFGFGLSYTSFDASCSANTTRSVPVQVKCTVTNKDQHQAGDEVIMVYHNVSAAIRAAAPHPIPNRALVGFERVSLAPSQTQTIEFTLSTDAFEVTTTSGGQKLYSGSHSLIFTNGNTFEQVLQFSIDG